MASQEQSAVCRMEGSWITSTSGLFVTALPLLRMANLIQWHLYFQNRRHGSLADVMEMIVNHKGPEMDTTDPAFRWYTLFSPVTQKSDQVFNGWTMQQAVVNYALLRSNRQGSGYRLALIGSSLTFVSDELGVIYYAPTVEQCTAETRQLVRVSSTQDARCARGGSLTAAELVEFNRLRATNAPAIGAQPAAVLAT